MSLAHQFPLPAGFSWPGAPFATSWTCPRVVAYAPSRAPDSADALPSPRRSSAVFQAGHPGGGDQ